jgi:hypothetical protein
VPIIRQRCTSKGTDFERIRARRLILRLRHSPNRCVESWTAWPIWESFSEAFFWRTLRYSRPFASHCRTLQTPQQTWSIPHSNAVRRFSPSRLAFLPCAHLAIGALQRQFEHRFLRRDIGSVTIGASLGASSATRDPPRRLSVWQ